MVKLDSPLLSLEAHKTLGNAITFQSGGKRKFARKKPIPSQPRSLAQMYQRWLYQDYIILWHALSSSQKQQWQSDAVPYHMTGFAYWMRSRLTNLPGIAASYHLDEPSGVIAYDSSRNTNNATVFGASVTSGLISLCRHFDNLDDYIDCGATSAVDITNTLTLRAIIRSEVKDGAAHMVFRKELCYSLNLRGTNDLAFYIWQAGGASPPCFIPAADWSIDTWMRIVCTFDGTDMRIYKDGVLWDTVNFPGTIDSVPATKLSIGARLVPVTRQVWAGKIDDPTVDSIARSQTFTTQYQERRYPL